MEPKSCLAITGGLAVPLRMSVSYTSLKFVACTGRASEQPTACCCVLFCTRLFFRRNRVACSTDCPAITSHFFKMPEPPSVVQFGIGMKKITVLELLLFQNKTGVGPPRREAGMPKTALVSAMPMPRYVLTAFLGGGGGISYEKCPFLLCR
jgi:hypothetical protein